MSIQDIVDEELKRRGVPEPERKRRRAIADRTVVSIVPMTRKHLSAPEISRVRKMIREFYEAIEDMNEQELLLVKQAILARMAETAQQN